MKFIRSFFAFLIIPIGLLVSISTSFTNIPGPPKRANLAGILIHHKDEVLLFKRNKYFRRNVVVNGVSLVAL